MRLSRTLAATATAVLVLAALTGCGGDAGESGEDLGGGAGISGGAPKDDGAPKDGADLPSAGDMASIEKFINQHAQCNNLQPFDEDGSGLFEEEAKDPAFAIKERAVCHDGSHNVITLLVISDMAKFQAANRDGEKFEVIVGKNFAVVPEGDNTVTALVAAKMLLLTCDPNDYQIPSGYKQLKGLAEGCVMTDYVRS
ncbi:hypothetical protein ACFYM0_23630 [Streptomyces sp. NPDC006487]|uniref:hypothetical protein n=1 Tax=Streptomyces sp. NPDC006487 TaxID=3364748 RepID=UPI00369B9659